MSSNYTYILLNNKDKEKAVKKKDVSNPKSTSSNNVLKSKKPDISKIDPNVPDRSHGDYYCQICDSHMNSEGMWEAHVIGKRHLRNVKRGDIDSKYDDLDVESTLKHAMKNVKDPVIGLNYIHEIRRYEPGIQPMYNCFLCCANLVTVPLVIEHVISDKHRMNFLKENNPKEYQLIDGGNFKKNQRAPLLAEKAALLEAEYGRGVVKVKREKKPVAVTYYKRSADSDIEEIPPKSSKFPIVEDKKGKSVWKKIDSEKKNFGRGSGNQRYKSSYYVHDDHTQVDNRRSSYSRREHMKPDIDDYCRSYSRISDQDENSRNSDNYSRHDHSKVVSSSSSRCSYGDDICKQTEEFYKSVERSSYPKYNDNSVRQVSSTNHSSDNAAKQYPLQLQTSQDRVQTNAAASSSRADNAQPPESKNALKDFVVQLLGLSKEYFLKITLMKLQDIENEELKKDELDVLMKIYGLSQQIIYQNLPPQVRELLKDKFPKNPQTKVEPVPQPAPVQNITLNDINVLLMKARQASELVKRQPSENAIDTTILSSSNIPTQRSSNFGLLMESMIAPSSLPQSTSNAIQSMDSFPAAPNNYQTAQTSMSYSSYSTSSIPGLNLAEENPPNREHPNSNLWKSNHYYTNY